MNFKLNFCRAHLPRDGALSVSKISIFVRTIYLIVLVFIQFTSSISLAGECFESQTLATLDLSSKQGALVYVWSPRMVLSAQHAAQVQQQATAAGLGWQPVHDPQLPPEERLAALAKLAQTYPASSQVLQNSQPLCDAQLIARDALRHFPTAFVWRDAPNSETLPGEALPARGWAGTPIVGAMPAPFWAGALRERLLP
jgi:hypothetical protein